MPHTRASVIKRTIKEFQLLDKQVAKLKPADWKRPLLRPETKDPWTIKDALAHVTYWKANTLRVILKQPPRPAEAKLEITDLNRLIYKRWRRRTPKEILAWHRQVQKDLLKALREVSADWFAGKNRGPDWPYDIDGHSTFHRLKDIARAVEK